MSRWKTPEKTNTTWHISLLYGRIFQTTCFSVTARAFPTWSKSCETSGQTRCRRWPVPLQDFCPLATHVCGDEEQSGGKKKNKRGSGESRGTEGLRVIYAGVDCWLTLAVCRWQFSRCPCSCHLYPGSSLIVCSPPFGYYSTSTRTNIPIRRKADKQETVAGSLGTWVKSLIVSLVPFFPVLTSRHVMVLFWNCRGPVTVLNNRSSRQKV